MSKKEQTVLKSTGEVVHPLPHQKGDDAHLTRIFKPYNQIELRNRRNHSRGHILYVRPNRLTTRQKAG